MLHPLRASISKPRLGPLRGTSARPAHRPSHCRSLTVLPAPRVPPLPSPAPDPQTVGETRTQAFEPQCQEASAIPMCCSLHVNCFSESKTIAHKDKLTSQQRVVVPVALPHAISDRQIRDDPLINSPCDSFSPSPESKSISRDHPPICRDSTYDIQAPQPDLPVNTRWQRQASSFARRSRVPL